MTIKDSQRSRVYAAEQDAWSQVLREMPEMRRFDQKGRTLAEAQEIIRALADRKLVIKHYPNASRLRRTKVEPGRNAGRAYSWNNTITLGVYGRERTWLLLHEAAHIYAGIGHDWAFADAYLYLWRQVFGVQAAKILEAQFKAHRVRYRKPRKTQPLTLAKRKELVARLAAAREAKALQSVG